MTANDPPPTQIEKPSGDIEPLRIRNDQFTSLVAFRGSLLASYTELVDRGVKRRQQRWRYPLRRNRSFQRIPSSGVGRWRRGAICPCVSSIPEVNITALQCRTPVAKSEATQIWCIARRLQNTNGEQRYAEAGRIV